MTISVAVMAVRQRARFVEHLIGRLGIGEERVVWDQKRDRCDTGLRAMQAYDPEASHHLVIQDDALVCRDLLAGIGQLVEHTGDHPVSLYIGRVRPHPQQVQERFNAARRVGSPTLKMRGPLWGVGIIYPTAHLEALCAWLPAQSHPNYDMRVSRWYMGVANLDCVYTVPSLVDHRPVAENPSTVEGRTGNRQAHGFIGEDASALDVDWQARLEGDGMATFRNVRSPHLGLVEAPDDSRLCVRLSRLTDIWERVDEPAPPEPQVEVADFHTGGGWYQLPDGVRVRGRAAAATRLAEAG